MNRVFRHISAQRAHSRLYNLGEPGVTAREIITRQLPALRARPCSIVFVVSGANEVQQYDRPSSFERDYASLIGQIHSRDPKAVLVCAGVPDVSLAQRIPFFVKPPIRWLSSLDNRVVMKVAARRHAFTIDYFSISQQRASKRLEAFTSQDGMHPSDAGYEAMAAAAFPAFDEALR